MADTLRTLACQALMMDADFFRPFFSPIRGGASDKRAYDAWVQKLHGDEEGDELVMLALCRLLHIAVQPVQQSGYRVPLMDPASVAEREGVCYWGNDDKHWVWLRQEAELLRVAPRPPSDSWGEEKVPAMPEGSTTTAPETPAAAPCTSASKPPLPVQSAPEHSAPQPSSLASRPPAHTVAVPSEHARAGKSPSRAPNPGKAAPAKPSKGAAQEYPVGLF
eukprot:1084597-Amphidinium_carterae.1